MANYLATDTDLAAVANKIRAKTGVPSGLVFPSGYVSEIEKLYRDRLVNWSGNTELECVYPTLIYFDGLSKSELGISSNESANNYNIACHIESHNCPYPIMYAIDHIQDNGSLVNITLCAMVGGNPSASGTVTNIRARFFVKHK